VDSVIIILQDTHAEYVRYAYTAVSITTILITVKTLYSNFCVAFNTRCAPSMWLIGSGGGGIGGNATNDVMYQ